MIRAWVYIIGFFFIAFIGIWLFYNPKMPYEASPEKLETVNVKNPIGFFCGADCSDCNHDPDTCLEIVKANLSHLCTEAGDKGCYEVWLQYAKTCQYLCNKPLPPLKTATKMVNLVSSDS